MSEEKKLILKMLKEDKISEDEALKLLEAIGNKETKDKSTNNKSKENTDFSTNGFVSKIISGVERAINIASKKIENMDFEFTGFNSQNFNARTEKTYSFNVENDINLFLKNKNGAIEINNSNSDKLEVIAKVLYDSNYLDENYEFIESKIENNDYYFGIKDESIQKNYTINFKINVPESYTKGINVINSNSMIKLNEIDAKNINLKTSNSKIELREINANEIIASTSNAKILLREIDTKTISTSTSNAKIDIYECAADTLKATTSNARITIEDININNVILKTSNGSIELNEIDSNTIDSKTSNGSISLSNFSDKINEIKAKSSNGTIRIEDINLERSVKAVISGKDSSGLSSKFTKISKSDNEVVATTEAYDPLDKNTLNIEAYTSNSKIIID